MEQSLVPPEGEGNLIFAPTTRAIRFYRNYFRKQLSDVLFVAIDDPDNQEALIEKFTREA